MISTQNREIITSRHDFCHTSRVRLSTFAEPLRPAHRNPGLKPGLGTPLKLKLTASTTARGIRWKFNQYRQDRQTNFQIIGNRKTMRHYNATIL